MTEQRRHGRVYTPDALARAIVAALPLEAGQRWLDPACGDGAFLAALADRADALGVEIELHGWDLDAVAVAQARTRLGARAVVSSRDALDPWEERWDGVVGNPPYLESKRMPDALKARVRARCPRAAHGAFDLYGAFTELGVAALHPGGCLAFLVPNRILVTAATEPLRAWLAEQGSIAVTDLSSEAVFDDAAVYPVLVTVRMGRSGYSVGPLQGPPTLALPAPPPGPVWPLPGPGVQGALLARVLGAGFPTLRDGYEARWTVSFHRSGLRDAFVFDERPQSPHARRFLGGGRFAGNAEVGPCRIRWAGSWIDHDEARARKERNALPALSLFTEPKLVVCQNARRCRAALDTEGFVLKDTFLAVRAIGHVDLDGLRWLALVLQSDLMHVLYEQLYGGTRKGGGYLHYLSRYLLPLPIPVAPEAGVVAAVHARLEAGEDAWPDAEALVWEAFGTTDEERAWLQGAEHPPREARRATIGG